MLSELVDTVWFILLSKSFCVTNFSKHYREYLHKKKRNPILVDKYLILYINIV